MGPFPLLHVPYWPAALLSIVLLDLVIYGQHVLFHDVPVLWRLHRVHHAAPIAQGRRPTTSSSACRTSATRSSGHCFVC